MNSIIIAAYSVALRDEVTAARQLQDLSPPESYVKQETKDKWMAKALADRQNKLPWLKATGDLVEVAAYDTAQQSSFFHSKAGAGKAAGEFADWLTQRYTWSPVPSRACEDSPLIFAFDVRYLLSLCGVNAVRQGRQVPSGLWHYVSNCFDPQQMLLETEAKSCITLQKLFLEAPGEAILYPDNYMPHTDVLTDLRLTTEMVVRYQLCPLQYVPGRLLPENAESDE